jgi:hypothetical protein
MLISEYFGGSLDFFNVTEVFADVDFEIIVVSFVCPKIESEF